MVIILNQQYKICKYRKQLFTSGQMDIGRCVGPILFRRHCLVLYLQPKNR